MPGDDPERRPPLTRPPAPLPAVTRCAHGHHHHAGPHAECRTPETCCRWFIARTQTADGITRLHSRQADAYAHQTDTGVTAALPIRGDPVNVEAATYEELPAKIRDALKARGWDVEDVRIEHP